MSLEPWIEDSKLLFAEKHEFENQDVPFLAFSACHESEAKKKHLH